MPSKKEDVIKEENVKQDPEEQKDEPQKKEPKQVVKKAPVKKASKKGAAYFGTGRRKDAIARVRLIPGKGEITVNGRKVEAYFGLKNRIADIKKPLRITNTLDQFDVIAVISGGGITGQAGALRHGIARALLEADEGHRNSLKKEGLLTRDSRMKERRKYGLKKARKAPQFSKR